MDNDVPLPDDPPPEDDDMSLDPLDDLRVLIDERFDAVDAELKSLRGLRGRSASLEFIWAWALVISVLIAVLWARRKIR